MCKPIKRAAHTRGPGVARILPIIGMILGSILIGPGIQAQINASLFRYPAVSQTQIVFSYANDLWIVPKSGGKATHLSSPPGIERYPRFSPDGTYIAFTANYDGNNSIYTMPVLGGIPQRVTWHGSAERVVDWYPDGLHLLFASGRASGRERFNQFYKIFRKGGPAEKLPLPYAEYGAFSPDGSQLAFTFKSQASRNWKRYRGGWNGQIHIFNLKTFADENISTTDADDEFPMWHAGMIYFLSDRGIEKRMNIWAYDLSTAAFTQITNFTDYDVHFPSLGPEDIVFEEGGKLFCYSISDKKYKEVPVEVVSDEEALRPRLVNAEKYMAHASLSPDGKRVLVEARGDIFSLPAENGAVKDLTQSGGVAERYPAWSPDGTTVAYWTDLSGEYELCLAAIGSGLEGAKQTSYGPGFRYHLFWSPDNKKLAFIDKAMKIFIFDRTTKETTQVDQGLTLGHDDLENWTPSWSPDSRWLAYARDLPNSHQGIFLYDYSSKKTHAVTSGFYNCGFPAFDKEGKYLFLVTTQELNPIYSDLDNTFIYPNAGRLAAIVLNKTTHSPLYPKNDTVSLTTVTPKKEKEKEATPPMPDIDIDGLESRLVLLPIEAGNYSGLQAAEGKLVYLRAHYAGSPNHERHLLYYDLEKRTQKTILEDANGYTLSADGKRLLVSKEEDLYIVPVEEDQKLEKKLHLNEMQMWVDPRAEWKQIFVDAWRMERDYFYDPNMHGVDWNKVRTQYLDILKKATTREDLDFILGEMVGELSSSHTYHGGGDLEESRHTDVGYLGVDWEADGDYYKVKKIIRGAPWDAEVRSPLDLPGCPIKEGDYILAVNGIPLTTMTEPYAAFRSSGRTVELTYSRSSSPSLRDAKTTVVETIPDESRLRYLAWIEQSRKKVEDATGGKVGYVYVPSTGTDGQTELIRQFTAQLDKQALIVDERFNNGGQIPDRFIEILDRKPLAWWATRDGTPSHYPPSAIFGPKVMLTNGWSGSGGDAFPDYFRKAGLGPIIGTRTWGGLIGISGCPDLIDGGSITVPTFRMFNPDGSWFKEGHGVDPDILVPEDLTLGAQGRDNQLERGIAEILELMKKQGFTPPKTPAYEVR